MFYFFKAKPLPEQKVQEKPLPKTGKLFLIFFTLLHVMFLFFNMYYFMPQTEGNIENTPEFEVENAVSFHCTE